MRQVNLLQAAELLMQGKPISMLIQNKGEEGVWNEFDARDILDPGSVMFFIKGEDVAPFTMPFSFEKKEKPEVTEEENAPQEEALQDPEEETAETSEDTSEVVEKNPNQNSVVLPMKEDTYEDIWGEEDDEEEEPEEKPVNPKKDLGKICALLKAGWKKKDIAEEIGVSSPTLALWIREAREKGLIR